MTARILGASAVAIAAIAAAGVGGYMMGRPVPARIGQEQTGAARTATVPATATTPGSPADPTSVSSPGLAAPVTETEAIVAPVADAADRPVERERAANGRTAAAAAPTREAARASAPKPSSRAAMPAPEPTAATRAEARPTAPMPAPIEAPRPAPTNRASTEPVATEPARETRPVEEHANAPVEPPPASPRIEEYVVPSDSVIGLQLDETISTETARVEQRVDAHVARDVRINGAVVIPAGARARGQVTVVEPGGKFRERARLGVRFHTLVLADGTSVPIQTEAIFREGDQVGQRSAARIGGSAVGGAIIGAIFGGGKGAAIGAAAGAGAGTAATMATQKSQVTLHAGSTVTVRLTSPTTVSVEREN